MILTLFLFLNFSFFTGEKILEGKVIDDLTEKPIGNVNIFLKNSYTGTISDSLGQFQIPIKDLTGDTLVISHIGFETKVFPLNSALVKEKLVIRLTPKIIYLKEIKVSGESKFDVYSILKRCKKSIKRKSIENNKIYLADYQETVALNNQLENKLKLPIILQIKKVKKFGSDYSLFFF